MQSLRRVNSPLLLTGVGARLMSVNPLGPSRGTRPPPWAVEKLLNEGYNREQILSNWEKLLQTKSSRIDKFEKLMMAIRRDYDISPAGIREMIAQRKLKRFREDQNYDRALTRQLGPDLAAARFLLERSATVQFKGFHYWTLSHEVYTRLPTTRNPAFKLEAIDLRNFQILHRAFEYLAGCQQLKSIKMVNQRYVDDFCLDALSGLVGLSLQYLDVSGCQLITERGLSSLHRCKDLRLLQVNNLPNVKHPELLAILLEETLPSVKIVGIDYLKNIDADKKT